jgi:uncharacterized membrane protein
MHEFFEVFLEINKTYDILKKYINRIILEYHMDAKDLIPIVLMVIGLILLAVGIMTW